MACCETESLRVCLAPIEYGKNHLLPQKGGRNDQKKKKRGQTKSSWSKKIKKREILTPDLRGNSYGREEGTPKSEGKSPVKL